MRTAPKSTGETGRRCSGCRSNFEAKIVRYSSFSQVIGAAIGGAGLALGRSPLIDPELDSGRLVRLFPDLSRPASWRFVLRPRPVAPPPACSIR